MSLVQVPHHQTLYHGSQKLYTIQCYIKRKGHLLTPYLQRLHSEPILDSTSSRYEDATDAIKYVIGESLIKISGYSFGSFSEHVALLYCLDRLDELEKSSSSSESSSSLGERGLFKVSDLLEASYQNGPDNYKRMDRAVQELLAFIREVETHRSIETLNIDSWAHYYSVMRQPIQFFGDRETALGYGKGGDKFIYGYDLDSWNCRFVDIDDPETITLLMSDDALPFEDRSVSLESEPIPGPFYSHFTYNEEDVYHYTEVSAKTIRENAYSRIKLEETTAQSRWRRSLWFGVDRYMRPEAVDDDYEPRELTEEELRLPTELYGDELRSALYSRFTTLYMDDREGWLVLSRAIGSDRTGTGAIDNERRRIDTFLVEHMMERFPLVTRENIEEVRNYIDIHFWDRGLNDKINLYAREVFLPTLLKLKRLFIPKDDSIDRLLNILQGEEDIEFYRTDRSKSDRKRRVAPPTNTDLPMEVALLERWTELFEVDLCSPRGVWYTLNWKRLSESSDEAKKSPRYSSYMHDSLAVYSFTTSDWFQKMAQRGVIGWRCSSMKEWMIYEPAKHGYMRKVVSGFDLQSDLCDPAPS